MGKQLSLLFALVLTGGCSAAHGDFETMCAGPLHATVTIEETGEVLAVERVFSGRSLGGISDWVFVHLERGEWFIVDFRRPAETGRALHFMNEPATPPEARVTLSDDLVHLCGSSEMSEGELILDYVHVGTEYVDCVIGSLRVRFADCDREIFGRPASETTLLVELGR